MTFVVAALAIVLSACFWLGAPPSWAIADASEIANGQLWRLLTGPLVHSDFGQAGRDLSMLILVGIVWERSFGRRYLPLMLLCLIVPTAAAVLMHPELGAYFGLSGAVNGLFTAALIEDLWRSKSGLIGGLLIVHVLKLAYESLSGGMLMPMELASGVTPLPEAHLTGALTGLLFSAVSLLIGARRTADIRLEHPP
jgi:rhomboid family GlyGly-CTERM serine protease